jgi:hypothetical protein
MILYWAENQWVLTKNQLSTSLIPKTSLNIDFGGKNKPNRNKNPKTEI